MNFDSVTPDVAVIVPVSAKVFRYTQTWAPFALHGLAIFLNITLFLMYKGTGSGNFERAVIFCASLFVLLASFLRRLSPYLISEIGSYRYDRVGSVVTRLLPNTRQSWIVIMSLASLTVGLPLYLYLFTHFTSRKTVYGFAMFGLSTGLGSPFVAFGIGLLLCAVVTGFCYSLVQLPLGGRNPIYVDEPQNRVRVWVRLIMWLPLTLLLLALFVFSRLLLCNGPLGRYQLSTEVNDTCGTGTHFLATLFGWFMVAVSYICLDVGMIYMRLLGGRTVGYYALEPRLDGLFSELVVWSLKVTVAAATFMDPIAAYLIAALFFVGLFVFTCFCRTSTIEVLEEIIRWSMLIVAFTSIVSLCLTTRRIPAAVPGLVLLLCWLGAVGGAVSLYLRRFGWELFGSGREVTADIIIL